MKQTNDYNKTNKFAYSENKLVVTLEGGWKLVKEIKKSKILVLK